MVRESTALTGGVIGSWHPLSSIGGFTFDTYLKQYYLTWGVLLGLFLYAKNLVRSKMGRAFLAVATSEEAASTIGINVVRPSWGLCYRRSLCWFAGSLFASIMSIANRRLLV